MRYALTLLLVGVSFSVASGAAWTTDGPAAGAIRDLVSAPSDPQTLYAASDIAVLGSTDGGATWTTRGFIEDTTILAVDPHSAATLFAASVDGVFRSTDAARTWERLSLPDGIRPSAILIDPRNSLTIYVGSRCGPIGFAVSQFHESAGIYRSSDGGGTWVMIDGLERWQICVEGLAFDPSDPDTLYATPVFSDDGYAVSSDAGASWSSTSEPVPSGEVVVDPRDGLTRYGIQTQGGTGDLLIRHPGQSEWSSVDSEGILDHSAPLDLINDPLSGRLFLATSSGIYRSGDWGRSWMRLSGAARDRTSALVFDPSSSALTIGTEWGIFRSVGFPWSEWSEVSPVLETSTIDIVKADPSDPRRMWAAGGNRLYRTTASGRSWELFEVFAPADDVAAVDIVHLSVGQGGSLWLALSRTGEPDQILNLPAGTDEWLDVPYPANDIALLVADPFDADGLYINHTDALRHSPDRGKTWRYVRHVSGEYPRALVADPRRPEVLVLGTSEGIAISSDRGESWSVVSDVATIGPMVSSPADPLILHGYVRDSAHDLAIAVSLDGGLTWSTFAPPPGSSAVVDIAPHPQDPRTLYVSMWESGVFVTRDGGESWETAGGLPLEAAGTLATDTSGSTLYAGIRNRSVWELPVRDRRRGVRLPD